MHGKWKGQTDRRNLIFLPVFTFLEESVWIRCASITTYLWNFQSKWLMCDKQIVALTPTDRHGFTCPSYNTVRKVIMQVFAQMQIVLVSQLAVKKWYKSHQGIPCGAKSLWWSWEQIGLVSCKALLHQNLSSDMSDNEHLSPLSCSKCCVLTYTPNAYV